jgi:predicted aspartyl protease
MSSCLPLILMALTSLWMLPGSRFQAPQTGSVADLLLADEVDQAEALLDKQPSSPESIAFRGEIQFRRGNFGKAETLYREALRADEKTARAHFGLGKLAMAKLNSKQAIIELKRAVGLSPKEGIYHLYLAEALGIEKDFAAQKQELQQYVALSPEDPDRIAEAKAALEMMDTLGVQDIGKTTAPDRPAPIPVQSMLNLLFTQATIDGKGPYKFVIDTGATQMVLSERLAQDLGLKAITSTVMHGVGGGGKVDTKLYKVSQLKIGDVTVTNLPVGTFDDPLVTQLADGIIGTAVLSDFVVTVDYPAHQLELTRKPPADPGETLGAWYFSNLLLIPLRLNDTFDGNFIVDTGAVTTVLSHSMAAKLGVDESTPGAKVDLGLAGVGGMEGVVLRVPNVTFKTPQNTEVFPQVVSINLKEISKMIGTEISGVVGYDFLKAYRVVLDYNNATIHLVR